MSGSSSKPVRIALIGVGGFGNDHLNTIRQLQDQGLTSLLSVADPALERYPETILDLQASGVRLYEDVSQMLAEESALEAVCIAAPIPCHEEIAQLCLDRGVFVYLEKPPVPLYSQLLRLTQQDSKRRIVAGFQMIESTWSQLVKTWITSGRLGRISEIRGCACWPRYDRYYTRSSWAGKLQLGNRAVFDGPATNALSHLIHAIMYFGASDDMYFGVPNVVQGEMYRARRIEGYDTTSLRGTLTSGTHFFAALTHATESIFPFQIEIIGSRGWARISQDGGLVESSEGTFDTMETFEDTFRRSIVSFLRYTRGEIQRPATLLSETRGYVLTTNGLLLSSGKVHEIDSAWVQVCGAQNDRVFSVDGLFQAVKDSVRSPLLFSERNFPWAVPTLSVSVEDPNEHWISKVEALLRSAVKRPSLLERI